MQPPWRRPRGGFLFQQEIIPGVVAQQDQDLAGSHGVGPGGLLQPGPVLAAGPEVIFQHLAVHHEGDGGLGLLDGDPQVGQGGRLLVRPAGHRKAAVGLDDGVGDVTGVIDVLAAQGLQQVGGGEAEHPQGLLVDLAVLDHRLGPPGQQVGKAPAVKAEHRAQQLEAGDEEQGDQAGGDGHILRLDGDGRQIGDQHGGDQLLGLQLAQLALAHHPHGKQDAEVDQHGAQE